MNTPKGPKSVVEEVNLPVMIAGVLAVIAIRFDDFETIVVDDRPFVSIIGEIASATSLVYKTRLDLLPDTYALVS